MPLMHAYTSQDMDYMSRPNPETTNCSTESEYEDDFQNSFQILRQNSLGSALKTNQKFVAKLLT